LQSQEEYFGVGELVRLVNLIDSFDARKVFLVAGKKSFKLSGAQERIATILKGISYRLFNSSQNPDAEIIAKGISLIRKFDPDLVVGIGGGSAIDTAKAINVLAVQKDRPEEYIRGKRLDCGGKPLVAIPTTSGTGSEATHFATIYIGKRKYSLTDYELMFPTVAIIDPSLTESVPKYVTACTGLDAICQGIESFWSVNSTVRSRFFAKEAIEAGLKSIVNAVNTPDLNSRINMSKAANFSGKAINITKTTVCHSVSYPMTAYFSIPHGHAVALTMPYFMEFNATVSEVNCNDERGSGFVKDMLGRLFSIMGCEDAFHAKKYFIDLMRRTGVEISLRKLGIGEGEIETIIENSYTQNRMQNNPRIVTKKDIGKILTMMLKK